MNPNKLILFSAVLGLFLAACSGGNDDDDLNNPDDNISPLEKPCESNTALTCDCEDPEEEGYRVCGDDSSWGECVCPSEVDRSNVQPEFREDANLYESENLGDLTWDGETLRVPSSNAGNIGGLGQGEVFVVTGETSVMGRIVEVTESGGVTEIKLDTENIALTDVFSQLHYESSKSIDLSDHLQQATGGKIGKNQQGLDLTATVFAGVNMSQVSTKFDPTVDMTIDIDKCWGGCARVCMSWTKRWYNPFEWFKECDDWERVCPIPYPCLNEFEIDTTADVTFGATVGAFVTVGGTVSETFEPIPEINVPLDPVAGLGLSIDISFPFYVELGVGGTYSLSYRIDTTGSLGARANYRPSRGWRTYEHKDMTATQSLTHGLSAQAWLEFGWRPTVYLNIASIAGPYVDIGPYIRGQADMQIYDGLKGEWAPLQAPVVTALAGARVRVGGKVSVVGIFDIVDFNITVFEWFMTLWTSNPECEIGDYGCIDSGNYRICQNDFGEYGDLVNHWSKFTASCAGGSTCSPEDEAIDRYPCARCGNNRVEGDEVCDNVPVNCAGGGPTGQCYPGYAPCDSDCKGFGTCVPYADQRCGNGIKEGFCEECDGDYDYCTDGCYWGKAHCLSDCSDYDSVCDMEGQGCGNGVREGCEACDGDTAGCSIGGYTGVLHCLPDCTGWENNCRIGDQACGNGVLEGDEVCDDGDTDPCTTDCNATCTGPTPAATCGNYIQECGEDCDIGPGQQFDCDADCSWAECGDGWLNTFAGEECDEGAANSDSEPNVCRTNCFPARCGDGVLDSGEVCEGGDDGSGHPCRDDCRGYEVCGNGLRDPGEVCDDGDTSDCAGNCSADCTSWIDPHCGNGSVDCGETCENSDPSDAGVDDGCNVADPNCQPGCDTCSSTVCGDGIVDSPGEVCDGYWTCDDSSFGLCSGPTDLTNCDPGTTQCIVATAFCSDESGPCTTLNEAIKCPPGETCTLYNGFPGECNAYCSGYNQCGNGIHEPFSGEQCDDGGSNSDVAADACRSDCQTPVCGDGVTDSGEQCDDGGLCFDNGQPCTTVDKSACTSPFTFCETQSLDGCANNCLTE